MAQRVVLHVGTMKSGTSFVQNVLRANCGLLEERGVLLPGRRWWDQVRAVHDLIGHGGPGQGPLDHDGPWERVAGQARAWPGTVVLSVEFLAPRGRQKISQVIEAFPDARVEVVLTARDLARTLPAMWQESVQNGAATTWPVFLEEVRAGDAGRPGPARWFWRHQGVAAIARRWAEVAGDDRLTVVTVPPQGAGPELLWERFAAACGVQADGLDLAVRSNPSVGAASASVLRALNERLAGDPLSRPVYHRLVKHGLAKSGLATRSHLEPALLLDEEAQAWVGALARRQVRRLRALEVPVSGDLADLLPRPAPPADLPEPANELAAALDGLAFAVRAWAGAGGEAAAPGEPSEAQWGEDWEDLSEDAPGHRA